MPRPSRQLVYERLERAVDELQRIGGLPLPDEARSIWRNIWYEETHHSTAIEGNTLLLKEVQLLLFEGRAVGGKELNEYLEVRAYADAAEWVYAQALHSAPHTGGPMITVTELREIHRLVVEPAWLQFPPDQLDQREGPGSFRRHNIEAFHSGMKPPEWPQVPSLVMDWVERVNSDSHGLGERHAIEGFADLHAEFERIHPFRDGNGRVGRLALNLLLVRYGYPPSVIYKKDRPKYLRSLDRADRGDPGPLGELLARAVKHNVDRFILPALAGPHKLVPLTALAGADFTQNALVLAAQRGRLRASQMNGQWYSSREYVEEYRRSRYRRQKTAPA